MSKDLVRAKGHLVTQLWWAGWPEGEPIYITDPPEGATRDLPASRKDYLRSLATLEEEKITLQDYRRASECMNAKACARAEEDALVAFIGHVAYIKYPEEDVTKRWFLSEETLALQDGFDKGVRPPARFDIRLVAATGSRRLIATRKTAKRNYRSGGPDTKDPTRSPKRARRAEYDTTTRNGVLIAREMA